jgi:chromosomal replication initiator protein
MHQEVNQRDREVVSAIQSRLVEQVGNDRFRLWFSSGVRLELASDTLRVIASDRFKLDRLRRFRNPLNEAAQSVLGRGVQLHFEVDTTQANPQVGLDTANPPNATPEAAEGPAAIHIQTGDTPPRKRKGRAAASSPATGPVSAGRASAGRASAGSASEETVPFPSRASAADTGFAAFVQGDGNRLAYEAARSTVRDLGRVSPLFLYGPSGSGKTHLLECIKATARRQWRGRRIVSLSAEQFTSDFLEALQGRGLPSFRRKYRDVDLLMIDDVQFFRGKRATLVEVLHTVGSDAS